MNPFDYIFNTLSIVFWFAVVMIPLVIIHEFGHLLMARLCGVKIPEYGIGLPFSKRLFYTRWKGIIWSFYPWLLGGFVRIYGDHDALDHAYETSLSDPKLAKEEYVHNRLQELSQNQELQFFIEENSLIYDQKWQNLASSQYFAGKEIEGEKDKLSEFQALQKQLETLIEWEFDNKLGGKTLPKDAFFAKNWFQQTLIIAGGVTFNMITAVLFFWIMFGFFGSITQLALNKEITDFGKDYQVNVESSNLRVVGIAKDSAAEKLGLKNRDEIIKFAGQEVKNFETDQEFRDLIQANKGREIEVEFKEIKTGETKIGKVTLEEKDGKTIFGVGDYGYPISLKGKDFFQSLNMAVKETGKLVELTFKGLGDMVIALLPQTQDRSALDNAAGPIAVGRVSGQIFELQGMRGVLYLLGAISVSLAVFNILPIPALDGGRWIIITLTKLTGRRNKKLEGLAISISMLLLLGLALLIAFKDVYSIFSGKI